MGMCRFTHTHYYYGSVFFLVREGPKEKKESMPLAKGVTTPAPPCALLCINLKNATDRWKYATEEVARTFPDRKQYPLIRPPTVFFFLRKK